MKTIDIAMNILFLFIPFKITTWCNKQVDDLLNIISIFIHFREDFLNILIDLVDFREDLLKASKGRGGHYGSHAVPCLTNQGGLNYHSKIFSKY